MCRLAVRADASAGLPACLPACLPALVPVQGTHTAMKSGMLAAEAAFAAMTSQPASAPLDLSAYETNLRQSWVSSSGAGVQECKQRGVGN